ncbi:CPn0927/CPn0928 family alpha/beta hydrolase fold protein [Chlamydia sp. 17-3921]|uniref:CPn0927/CPn0928 family alpha/beta hydrolase fold protein n=1 Tax=Chlamydia sp. 17-3921 TaxID=2675798 RepID=UPI0019184CA9|nr:CPn0927/CPn0928 family alpha/beta hydrolase fold protein [Chlamydia sp. 17-3921]
MVHLNDFSCVQPFCDKYPQPSVLMFSSEKHQVDWVKRRSHPRLYTVVDILLKIAKFILALVLLIPLGVYWLLQGICQNIIIPSAGGILFRSQCRVNDYLQNLYVERIKGWIRNNLVANADRVVLQYDHLQIDTLKLTFPNAHPDRWMLVSLGNAESVESCAIKFSIGGPLKIARKANANVLLFNYPGVVFSKGPVSVQNLTHAYRGCVRYLRDNIKGPQAKQIIAYGYSLGASIQAEALSQEVTDGSDGVDWFVIKDRGARSLATVGKQWLGPIGAAITKFVGWDIDSEKHSSALVCPELFICSIDENRKLIGDGLFSKESSFAAPFFDPNRKHTVGRKISVEQVNLNHVQALSKEAEDLIVESIEEHYNRHKRN